MNDKYVLDYLLGEPTFWEKYGTLIIILSFVLLLVIAALILYRKQIRAYFLRKSRERYEKSLLTVNVIDFQEVKVEPYATYSPPIPEKAGYSFKGWFSDSALTVPWVSTQKVSCNMTLYPKWEKE
jgi:uncharacterized repeat protein (TIGR02543 family)